MSNRLLFLMMLLWLAFLFPSSEVASNFTVDISTSAVFKRGEDTMWRCYTNITIQNIHSENITLMWASINLINITFVDETSEQLTALPEYNFTCDPPIVLKPEDKFTLSMVATENGFDREPKVIWIRLSSSFFEASSPLVVVLPLVPEYSSFLILSLLMIAILLTVIVYRRKHTITA